MKRAIPILLTVMLTLSLCCTVVFSHDVPDLTRKGSVTVKMQYGGAAVSGGAMTIYRVADVTENNGNYGFTLIQEFYGLDVILDDLESAELIKILSTAVQTTGIPGVSKAIDFNGTVEFNDLKAGLYLLVQDVAATGYTTANPFLVSLPSYTDGKYVYDIDASTKAELEVTANTTYARQTSHKVDTDEPGLPQTGQLKWPIPVLIVSGIGLVTVGWILCFVKGKDNEA